MIEGCCKNRRQQLYGFKQNVGTSAKIAKSFTHNDCISGALLITSIKILFSADPPCSSTTNATSSYAPGVEYVWKRVTLSPGNVLQGVLPEFPSPKSYANSTEFDSSSVHVAVIVTS